MNRRNFLKSIGVFTTAAAVPYLQSTLVNGQEVERYIPAAFRFANNTLTFFCQSPEDRIYEQEPLTFDLNAGEVVGKIHKIEVRDAETEDLYWSHDQQCISVPSDISLSLTIDTQREFTS